MSISKQQFEKIIKENERLKIENHQLKELLRSYNIQPNISNHHIPIRNQSKEKKINDRIRIFRSLFKGRMDVFAIRWEYESGKQGYSPAYKPGSQKKQYLPMTDQVIYDHLSGEKTIGIFPILIDNTCWFLAVDFDKKNWKEDAKAFLAECKSLAIPACMERSRSGNGCHIWIFFSQPVPAKLVRKLGSLLLTQTLEKRHQMGINSYDRMFPNQDNLPKGGFGNLIALPLQHYPRQKGNSVFVDENLNVYPNQWLYLSTMKKMTQLEVEKIVKDQKVTTPNNRTVVNQKETPAKINVICKNGIHIPKVGISTQLLQKMKHLATFNNPAYYKNQAKRLSTYNIPKRIDCSEENQENLILPRGCMESLEKLLDNNSLDLIIDDQTNFGSEINVTFYGQLRPQQEEAVQALLKQFVGILSATTGFGKTVVAASLIAKRGVNTLIIVHRKQLIDQWKERLVAFLKLDEKEIGQIGGGKNTAHGVIDIATIQSLHDKGSIAEYGQIIVDECHHISAFSFEQILKKADAKYVHGLTATPTRKDGLHPIMKMQCGPIRHKVSEKDQIKMLPFERILLPKYTSFKSKSEEEVSIQSLYEELIDDEQRNKMIFDDVLKELDAGSCPLILTERVEHVRQLELMFKNFAKNIIVLTGGLNKKEERNRLEHLKTLPDSEERLIIATGKYIGEGFDYSYLNTLFLAMPISWKGTLQQYVGRLHRLHADKNVVKVYDYVDYREPVFKKMFEKRRKGYKTLGYKEREANSNKGNTMQMKLF